ncbi:MAG: hypothetical protein IJX77_09490 [Ruminococcus sp.]|nr:hypothetical protein [Ruminococcus sp.]
MKKSVITQKHYAMFLVPMMTVTLVCNFLLYIKFIGNRASEEFISVVNVTVLIIGFILICLAGITRKSEQGDELSVLNRYKSLSITSALLFAALLSMVFYFMYFSMDFTLRVDMYFVSAVISGLVIVEESLFLWFDRTPKEAEEE